MVLVSSCLVLLTLHSVSIGICIILSDSDLTFCDYINVNVLLTEQNQVVAF